MKYTVQITSKTTGQILVTKEHETPEQALEYINKEVKLSIHNFDVFESKLHEFVLINGKNNWQHNKE